MQTHARLKSRSVSASEVLPSLANSGRASVTFYLRPLQSTRILYLIHAMETLVSSPPSTLHLQHAYNEDIENDINSVSNGNFADKIQLAKNSSSPDHRQFGTKNDEKGPAIFHDKSMALADPNSPTKSGEEPALQLDSSPIKRSSHREIAYVSKPSSCKKKTVAFSDDLLVSDLPSSPPRGSIPKKSILKPQPESVLNSPSPRSEKLKSDPFSPHSVEFWHSGSIVQVAPLSTKLSQLVDGCMHVLQNESFDRKFEVYATLNNICKTNPPLSVVKLFTNRQEQKRGGVNSPRNKTQPSQSYVETIARIAKRDILAIESNLFGDSSYQNDDPFSTRVANQALKLANFILITPELNMLLSVELAQFYYSHAASMIAKPDISKSLILPYILILKECRFNAHRKRMVFDNDFPDLILQGLLKMKNFKSSSLVVERMVALKNLLVNFPHTFSMPGNITPWLETLLLTMCDVTSPVYTKYASIGALTMLEAARSFLTYKNVVPSVRKLLDSKVPQSATTFASNHIEFDKETSMMDHVIGSLQKLLDTGEVRLAMDFWTSLILLTCNNDRFYEKSSYFTRLIKVHESCLKFDDSSIREIAISSWNAVTYSLCQEAYKPMKGPKSPTKEKYDPIANSSKMGILLRPLTNLNATVDKIEFTALHNIYMGIIYTLGNPIESLPMYFAQEFWKQIIHDVCLPLYYSKDSSQGRQQHGIKLIKRLLNLNAAGVSKPLDDMRCLSTEPVFLTEIRPLCRQTIHGSADIILPTLRAISEVSPMQALEALGTVLDSIKPILKKEVRISNATMGYLSSILNTASHFVHQDPLYFFTTKLIRVLILNFDIKLLKSIKNGDSTVNVFQHIISTCEGLLPEEDVVALIDYITQLAGDDAVENNDERPDESQEMLNKKLSEITLFSEMLKNRHDDCDELVQKVIANLASVPEENREQALEASDIGSWTMAAFKAYLKAVQHSEHDQLRGSVPSLICRKLSDNDTFLELTQFIVQEKFVKEIFEVREEFLAKSSFLKGFLLFDFKQKVKSLLSHLSDSEDMQMFDEMLVTCYNHKHDIKPHIKNRWAVLPKLKEAWLRDHDELYHEMPSTSNTPVKEELTKSSPLPAISARGSKKSKSPMGQIKIGRTRYTKDSNSSTSSSPLPKTSASPLPQSSTLPQVTIPQASASSLPQARTNPSPCYTTISEISPMPTPTRALKRESPEHAIENSDRKRIRTPVPQPAAKNEIQNRSTTIHTKLDELEAKLAEVSNTSLCDLEDSRRFQLESRLIDLMYKLRQPSC